MARRRVAATAPAEERRREAPRATRGHWRSGAQESAGWVASHTPAARMGMDRSEAAKATPAVKASLATMIKEEEEMLNLSL